MILMILMKMRLMDEDGRRWTKMRLMEERKRKKVARRKNKTKTKNKKFGACVDGNGWCAGW